MARGWRIACVGVLIGCGAHARADDRIQLQVDTSQADAVLTILARRTAGEPVRESDWERLFETEPYRRLKQRETELKRGFEDDAFRRFVLSDPLLAAAGDLRRTVVAWQGADLEAAGRRVLAYLPPQARLRAKVFPVIKPQTNSFVFEPKTDPAIFLYVDPTLGADKFENTVSHELHHIGLASVAGEMEAALDVLPARARSAAEWMGAFGEGMAMLAAAGGPAVHPHAHSTPEDRARWDHDVANAGADLRALDRFFLDIVEGRLTGEDRIREKGFAFFGVQGPWYTVGWTMAVLVERTYGRAALVECMLDPRRLLATYNQAVTEGRNGSRLPRWSTPLLEAVRARPAGAATPARR